MFLIIGSSETTLTELDGNQNILSGVEFIVVLYVWIQHFRENLKSLSKFRFHHSIVPFPLDSRYCITHSILFINK